MAVASNLLYSSIVWERELMGGNSLLEEPGQEEEGEREEGDGANDSHTCWILSLLSKTSPPLLSDHQKGLHISEEIHEQPVGFRGGMYFVCYLLISYLPQVPPTPNKAHDMQLSDMSACCNTVEDSLGLYMLTNVMLLHCTSEASKPRQKKVERKSTISEFSILRKCMLLGYPGCYSQALIATYSSFLEEKAYG